MQFDKLIQHLKLDKQEFIFQFNSHPNYPSALAFSDTLNFMGVKNDAYELDKQYWDELPDEFIAIVDDSFSLVRKSGNQYTVYAEKVKTLNKAELHARSTDFILLFEKNEHPESKKVTSLKPLLYIASAIIVLYSAVSMAWYEVLFNLVSLAGVYISLEIFNQKFGSTSTVISSICGDTSASQTVNSCHKIINQDKTSILGLKFSDFSLIYFTGLLVMGIFLPATAVLIKGITLVSMIAVGYSVYIQAFVEKTYCRVCLIIISLLVAQLLLGFLFFGNTYVDYRMILLCLALWIAVFSLILYLNNTLSEKESLQKSNSKNLRFKRNYDLFKRELTDSEKVHFSDQDTFSLGKKDAKIRISIVSNPYCGFCKDAHTILEKLLEQYPDEISAQIRFNYSAEQKNDKFTGLISDFMSIYRQKPEAEFIKAMDLWFKTKDESKIRAFAGTDTHPEDLTSLIRMSAENREAGLNFTPIFLINGYQFPEKYDREDIHYFISELIEDEEL
ncbi:MULTISPECIES: vitamin K epoxide reductase family protein [Chryseobacterium]|uniref:Membrane protein/thiol-disulfide isomerase/thioredoxin n=1 Tax=Chryseobacterium camelliae TaxID=1265445 RepID=A0ABU0TP25_9FLAO|nr:MULTISPECIES: thioredoxin domain-containing protein [Chryseobacterium]MDT3407370.1 putative membrane protein/thiol-disulfide isomerase/thioredoxin [Pseudacidovorax intermedius]MDQ1098782.1 putative membrane protein/thiol-disulfide isomerase/thioredoxin [Chryseobacterium camelliae]MDQ1102705.1 putative membrane protein/thiol-disulfide isomerase/thioredoxin [Chryseobacterium sp. SORGH_AS_1048]MDR6086133.1 putative membrane protein/thiol-disulfide isomerase/thioredoxin [Chryseobacterium sp. SOR